MRRHHNTMITTLSTMVLLTVALVATAKAEEVATTAQPTTTDTSVKLASVTTTAGAAAAATTETQAQSAQVQTAPAGDPYGFTAWLNSVRAQYGLQAVGYDPNLTNWASVNNQHQASRGIGHFVMGPARRQNCAMGHYTAIGSMWLASPAHAAALLDPTITYIGIAGYGAYWTFNAY
jgi:uncharacterized protein YkwD